MVVYVTVTTVREVEVIAPPVIGTVTGPLGRPVKMTDGSGEKSPPRGFGIGALMVAVKVTGWPYVEGFGELCRVVVVATGLTVSTKFAVAGSWRESPL